MRFVPSLAIVSLHTSPLVQPGSGDSGGMNVYVRELAGSLAQAGVQCQVYVRRWAEDLPDVVDVEPGFQVIHVTAGPVDLAKEKLPAVVDEFTDGMRRHLAEAPVDLLHANYWLSGEAGHWLKHELEVPLVSTFHTLARVKAETGDPEPERRIEAEGRVIGCSDAITASCQAEADQLVTLYDADPSRIELVPPGVDHAFFSPGNRGGARRALGLPGNAPVLLFVGRVQPLKGLQVAIETLADVRRRWPTAVLVVVGGPSGVEGDVELAACTTLAQQLGVSDAIRWVDPQPHHMLSTFYRSADVVLVPSRSESFGLVALEAAACGVPVVAAAVGGLTSIVIDGETGFLVEGRDPRDHAKAVIQVLADPVAAATLGSQAARHARSYTWSMTAARLRRMYSDLTQRAPVVCS